MPNQHLKLANNQGEDEVGIVEEVKLNRGLSFFAKGGEYEYTNTIFSDLKL